MHLHLTETLALLVGIGIGAQWLGWRLQMPAIVLLSVTGLVIGPLFGLIRPSADLGAAYQPLIKLAVAAILFEGGLSLRFAELRKAATGIHRLITIAPLLSLGLGAAAAHWIAGLSWPVALVLGAITVVTGPTVILPLLRQTRLRQRPASFLKWEGIVNDPSGALLATIIFYYFVGPDPQVLGDTLAHLLLGVLTAAALGIGAGWLLGRAFLRGLVPEYLKGPVALALALGLFAVTNLVLEEAGLITATLFGIVLGNMNLPGIAELRRFKESISILLVSCVFLLLTADLDPSIMGAMGWRDLLLLAALILLVRPLAVWIATMGAGMQWQERALVGWVAPRGVVAAAVAGVFGPALAEQGFAGAEELLPLVSALILITVVLHGFSLGRVATRLGLTATRSGSLLIAGANPWSSGLAMTLHQAGVPVLLADNSPRGLDEPRRTGVPVFLGELLSEEAEYSLEPGAFGSLLASTDNEAYNALLCAHFAPELGRQRVFQLAADAVPETLRLLPGVRGRVAFTDGLQFDDLQQRWYQGWGFHLTKLTKDFDINDLRARLPAGAVFLASIDGKGAAQVIEAGQPFPAERGQRVVWFGAGEVDDRGAAASRAGTDAAG